MCIYYIMLLMYAKKRFDAARFCQKNIAGGIVITPRTVRRY